MIKKFISQLKELIIIFVIISQDRKNFLIEQIYIKNKNLKYNRYNKKTLYMT